MGKYRGLKTNRNMNACRWVPATQRGSALSQVYAACSAGTVISLIATPLAADALGWPAALQLFSGAGLALAVCEHPDASCCKQIICRSQSINNSIALIFL